MAQISNTFSTYDAIGEREDLSDVIYNISPTDTPFMSAIAKTKAIERITNNGSKNANRCIEIASGAELTEAEKNATKKSEINTECPSIANPNYVPY